MTHLSSLRRTSMKAMTERDGIFFTRITEANAHTCIVMIVNNGDDIDDDA